MSTIPKYNYERIDPQLAVALDAVPRTPAGVYDLGDIPTTQAGIRQLIETMPPSPNDAAVSMELLEAPRDGAPAVPIRLFRPKDISGPMPAFLWFHGGGQVLGFAEQDDAFLKDVSAAVGCAVAAIDYRLAPETSSPGAAEDGYQGYLWLLDHASELGIDANRVGLAGASGGGNVAAATALMLRDRGEPMPLFQSLSYPMLDDRNVTPSSKQITDIGVWDRATNIHAWNIILPDDAGGPDVSPYSAPARADDLRGLPPTFIAVGELDVFRDEDMTYATKLLECDVPIEFHLYPGAYHAWDIFAPEARMTVTFRETWFSYLARQFAV